MSQTNKEKRNFYVNERSPEAALKLVEHIPVAQLRDQLRPLLREHPNLVFVGRTGSGKTTCLGPLLLELKDELGLEGRVAISVPRRLAATRSTERVSEMMDSYIGDRIGSHVRFENLTSRHTELTFMTDGILLRKMQYDPYLLEYSIVMIDEAHEQSLNIYLCLGLLMEVNKRRSEIGIEPIRIVVSSATIDKDKFARYIGEGDKNNSVEIPGKMFPVQVFYEKETPKDYDYIKAAADKVKRIVESKVPGDILIFMPGKREIHKTIEAIKAQIGDAALDIFPLHAEQSSEDHDKIFLPTDKRRGIVATNIAATALTFPDLRHVVISGKIKQVEFNPKTGIEQLVLTDCSLGDLKQMEGRAGRVTDGFCHYLFTEDSLRKRHSYQKPEIQRSNLSQSVLVMKKMGITDISGFNFVDKPESDFFLHAEENLYLLGATNKYGDLTEVGDFMSDLGLEPEGGAMIVEAMISGKDNILEVITITALSNGKNLFVRPIDMNEAKAADMIHKEFFANQDSDFTAMLNVWQAYTNSGYSKDWAVANYLNDRTLEEAKKLRLDLIKIIESRKVYINQSARSRINKDSLGRAITAGLVGNLIISHGSSFKKLDGTDVEIDIHPNSIFHSRNFNPGTILAAGEIFMNTEGKVYASRCMLVKSEWIKAVAPELDKLLQDRKSGRRQKNRQKNKHDKHSKNVYDSNSHNRSK